MMSEHIMGGNIKTERDAPSEQITAKEYLSQAPVLKAKIKSMTRQIETIEDALSSTSVILSDMPKPATPNVHRFDGLIAAKIDLEREVTAAGGKLEEIICVINALPDLMSAVLTNRYIARMRWNDMSREMFISERQLYRLHDDALAEVKKCLSKKDGSNGSCWQ